MFDEAFGLKYVAQNNRKFCQKVSNNRRKVGLFPNNFQVADHETK